MGIRPFLGNFPFKYERDSKGPVNKGKMLPKVEMRPYLSGKGSKKTQKRAILAQKRGFCQKKGTKSPNVI